MTSHPSTKPLIRSLSPVPDDLSLFAGGPRSANIGAKYFQRYAARLGLPETSTVTKYETAEGGGQGRGRGRAGGGK